MNALRACARRTRGLTLQQLRAMLALMLILTLGTGLAGPTPPARAADIDYANPSARIQVILRSMYIYEDRDLIGGGEFTLTASFYRCPPGPEQCVVSEGVRTLTRFQRDLDADTNDTFTIDHILPSATDASYNGFTIDEASGIPLFRGETYIVRVGMTEHDVNDDDTMGYVDIPLNNENGWHVGTFSQDALRNEGRERGNFVLDFEIARTPLADLVPFSVPEYVETSRAAKQICARVNNIGLANAPSSTVTFWLPQGSFPQNAIVPLGIVSPRHPTSVCTLAELPTSGTDLRWGVWVDSNSNVPEMDEDNNKLMVPFTPRAAGAAGPLVGPAPSPEPPSTTTPTPTPTAGKADLTVSAIKVNGQVPDGKDDCKDGKNTVAVLVKNTGSANAGEVQLRLVMDGAEADAPEQDVKELKAGEERELKFGGVQLKKGLHTLVATVDAEKAVAEADEANNTRTVTASCSDGN